ncbi:MAG TPA: hypothetical protein VLW50_03910 [Streptosporangiaceae bacterium]|nr:hypothetical protein [Streptosporangiaceae bacterium]
MATRGDAYGHDRGQRGGTVGARRGGAGPVADTRAAVRAARIADRYHLEDRISESGQSTLWRAFDDVLGRPVTVRTFGPGFARAADVVAAARAACRVPDHRLARVFDAHVAADGAYIVTEWPDGEDLEDLLLLGLLDVGWVTSIVAEVASALAAAHAAGIAHLRLTPRSVVWSRDTGVKILGLGIDAALAGTAVSGTAVSGTARADVAGDGSAEFDAAVAGPAPPNAVSAKTTQEMAAAAAALADTRALGQLLYAALTACWPGSQQTALPSAPRRDGRPYRPRQVRAGVPARIDEITCRALFAPLPRDPVPITSPGQLAELLTGALRYESRPPASAVPPGAKFVDSMDGTGAAERAGGLEAAAVGHPTRPRRRRRVRTLAAGGVVGALFFLDSAIIGISLLGAAHAPDIVRSVAHTQQPASRPHRPPGRLLEPASAEAFDPYGSGENENDELAPWAIDGNDSTAWHTDWYTTPLFGNLKPGTGLVVDMGHSVTITNVRVLLGSVPGADVQLRIGDSTQALGDMGVAARARDAGGQITLRPAAAYRGRYVLVWFTKLPPDGDGTFQADVYEVAVHGS